MLFVVRTKRHLDEDASSGDSTMTWSLAQLTLRSKDGPTRPSPYIQTALGFFMAVVLFCLHGLRVLWPKGFDGELPQHDIDSRSNGDVDYMAGNGRYAFLIFNIMMVAHLLFLVSVAEYDI